MTLPVWTIRPDWQKGITETLEWLSDVLGGSYGTEQVRALRLSPRRLFEMGFNALEQERTLLDLWLHRMSARDFLLPLFHDHGLTSAAIAAGATSVPFDTSFREFEAGGSAILLGADAFTYDVLTIEAVEADSITVAAGGVTRDWPAGSSIHPLRQATLDDQSALEAITDTLGQGTLRFELNQANDLIDEGAWETIYAGYPVITREPNRRENLKFDYALQTVTVDAEVGLREMVDDAGRAFTIQNHLLMLVGREEHWAFRQTLYRLRGQQGAVWVPSFNDDLKLSRARSPADSLIDIRQVGYAYTGGIVAGRDHLLINTPPLALTVCDLNFAAGTYSVVGTGYGSIAAVPGYSFIGGGFSVFDSDGSIDAFAANVPPINGFGYHALSANTNFVQNSQVAGNRGNAGCSITNNAIAAPDGTMTADLVADLNTGASASTYLASNVSGFTTIGPKRLSAVFKAGPSRWVRLQFSGSSYAYFDTLTGTVGTVVGCTAGVTALPNGWFYCWAEAANASLSDTFAARWQLADADNVTTITRNGTHGVYMWQLSLIEVGGQDPIIPTPAGGTASIGAQTLSVAVPNGSYTATYTFDDDSTQNIATTVSTGAFALPVYPTLNRPRVKRVQLVEAIAVNRTITRQVTALGGAPSPSEERLILDSAVGVDLPVGATASFMDICRGATDSIEIKHITDTDGVAESSLSFRAFRDERTTPDPIETLIPASAMSMALCGTPTGGCVPETFLGQVIFDFDVDGANPPLSGGQIDITMYRGGNRIAYIDNSFGVEVRSDGSHVLGQTYTMEAGHSDYWSDDAFAQGIPDHIHVLIQFSYANGSWPFGDDGGLARISFRLPNGRGTVFYQSGSDTFPVGNLWPADWDFYQ